MKTFLAIDSMSPSTSGSSSPNLRCARDSSNNATIKGIFAGITEGVEWREKLVVKLFPHFFEVIGWQRWVFEDRLYGVVSTPILGHFPSQIVDEFV